MVSVAEASAIILTHPFIPGIEKVAIINAIGRILAEPIKADRDFPPFHRVSMDGIAIRFEAYAEGKRTFTIEAVQAAGQPKLKLKNPSGCIEVMTGAMLPEDTDTVVRYEDIEIKERQAIVRDNEIIKGQNIHYQGMDAKKDELLISQGMRISSSEVALLASVGKSDVAVYEGPRIAIISTGDELVAINEQPLPHQLRKSNGYALQSALLELGLASTQFHIIDQKEILKTQLKEILSAHDLIILSGGISKGKFDFIPEVLESLGIKKLIHQVSQKPGKPFWFGAADTKTVFALPGNPVSTYMCFYRYIKPWLMKSWGSDYPISTASLANGFSFKPPLTYFLQVQIKNESGKLMAYPLPGGGSGDFANLKEVDGFLELPADKEYFNAQEVFPFIPFRNLF